MSFSFENFKVGQRLAGMIALAVVTATALTDYGVYGISTTDKNLQMMYENRMKPVKTLTEIGSLTDRNIFEVAHVLGSAEPGAGKQAFWRGLDSCQTQIGEFKLQDKSGNDLWFQGYYAAVADTQGKLRKVVAYLTDITNSMSKAQDASSVEAGVNKVFAIAELDMGTRILNMNDVFLNALG